MYSFTSRVRYSEIGQDGRLTIPALVDYLQDCTTFGSEELGLGPAHTAKTGLAWLLSAWEIEISELPRFGEKICVSTWATGFAGLRASRNFTVRREGDEAGAAPLVRADSSWFMFDANKGRPVRTPKEESTPYLEDARDDAPLDLPPIPRMVRVEGEGVAACPITVTGAHLDTNHHVNNAQFISLAGECLPKNFTVHRMRAEYKQQAHLGDVLHPLRAETENGCFISLNDEKGQPYVVVEFQ